MKRSEIRDKAIREQSGPGFRCPPSGLRQLCFLRPPFWEADGARVNTRSFQDGARHAGIWPRVERLSLPL